MAALALGVDMHKPIDYEHSPSTGNTCQVWSKLPRIIAPPAILGKLLFPKNFAQARHSAHGWHLLEGSVVLSEIDRFSNQDVEE